MPTGAPYNVIAAFPPTPDGTIVAVDGLRRGGVPEAAITVHRPGDAVTGDAVAELEAELQDELDAGWGPASGPQARGAATGALILGLAGVAVGLVAGGVWAYAFGSGLARLGTIVIVAGVIGLAGATVGLVAGGAQLDRPHGEELDTGAEPEVAERDVLVAVHVHDPVLAARAAGVLRELGAERVHLVDGRGVPLPPQADHPRPADPDGWWWTAAGEG
jgi:hypothetical protein